MPAGSTYTPIATTTLGSAAASYTFSSIPSTYTDLVLIANFGTSVNTNVYGRFNGDGASTGLYSDTNLYGNGTSATSSRDSNNNHFYLGPNMNASTTNVSTNSVTNLMNYANTSVYKTIIARTNSPAATSYSGTEANVFLYRSTSAITSMTLYAGSGNLVAGCSFTLYGIAAA